MVALRDLQPASFRGIRFLVPRDSADEGPNIVAHRYPGKTSGHYMEPNGTFEPNFHVHAVIHGADLLGQFERLRKALNSNSPGTLKHPWYGSQTVLAKHPWKVSRDDRDSGVLEIDIHFVVAGLPSFPSIVSGLAASIAGLSGATIASVFTNLASSMNVPNSPFSQAYVNNIMAGTATAVQTQFPATADVATAARVVSQAVLTQTAFSPTLTVRS